MRLVKNITEGKDNLTFLIIKFITVRLFEINENFQEQIQVKYAEVNVQNVSAVANRVAELLNK